MGGDPDGHAPGNDTFWLLAIARALLVPLTVLFQQTAVGRVKE